MKTVSLTASDGHTFPACVANPKGKPKGGVVVFQEAFGVTAHIKDMCHWLADAGYMAVAPEMFARVEPDPAKRDLPYTKAGLDAGRNYIMAIPQPQWLEDVKAAVAHVEAQGLGAATLGYCWGGSLAYLGACQIPTVKAGISYYGGMMAELSGKMKPACPVQFHLATLDRYIPLEPTKAALEANVPHGEIYVYEADHGFNRTGGAVYDDACAQLARMRTLELLKTILTKT